VMMIAMTPSLNASSRFFSTLLPDRAASIVIASAATGSGSGSRTAAQRLAGKSADAKRRLHVL